MRLARRGPVSFVAISGHVTQFGVMARARNACASPARSPAGCLVVYLDARARAMRLPYCTTPLVVCAQATHVPCSRAHLARLCPLMPRTPRRTPPPPTHPPTHHHPPTPPIHPPTHPTSLPASHPPNHRPTHPTPTPPPTPSQASFPRLFPFWGDLLRVASCLPLHACRSTPATPCLLPLACCPLPATPCLLPLACCPLPAAPCLLPLACCPLPATPCLPCLC